MKHQKPVPTDLELEILKVIWQRGEATVRQVYNDIRERREIAYTTVLTMMGVLERKSHLKKEAGERAYIYRPTRPQDEVVHSMVTDFVGRFFTGSAKNLMVHLVEDRGTPPEDLDEIETLVRDKRRRR